MPVGFGAMLRNRRNAMGLSTEEVGKRIHMHHSSVTRFENETQIPPSEVDIRLQEILQLPEAFIKMCEQARRERGTKFKRIWNFAHEHEHVGDVWIYICPSAKTKTQAHKYTITTYGDHGLHHATCLGTIEFPDNVESICLIHRKMRHGDLHVSFDITPDAEVSFGKGKSPYENTVRTENWKTKSKIRLLYEIFLEGGYLAD